MRVARTVIDRLVANGIDTVFGIPGKQSLPLNEAIGGRDDIRFVVSRHETAVSHQAWGYAETSGKTAATLTIPGPGDMNAMNGLKNALNDCTPLIHFAVETSPEIRGGDGIHETSPDTYDNVVKSNLLVEQPESTAVVVEEAIAVAETPPKGPVRVGIPKNFLPKDIPIATPGAYSRDHTKSVSDADVDAAATLLANATNPVIIAGGGVRASGASAELCAVANRVNAPVVTTYKGKGVIPEDNELSMGTLSGSASPELLACLADSDTGLAVGTDFDAVTTRTWEVEMPTNLVHITLDPDDLGNGYEPNVGIVADARKTLTALENTLSEREISAVDTGRAKAVRRATQNRIEELMVDEPPLTSVRVLDAVRTAVPREAIVAVDAGGFRVWGLNTFDAYGPRSYVNPGSWATMGTGVPSGIGAQLANPDDDVVVLTGDGGLMMCVHELHTAVAEELPITVIVLNNNDYAIISEDAGRNYKLSEGEYGWGHAPIEFTALAESMGMCPMSATTPEAIRDTVEAAVKADEPVLIEIPTDPLEPQASAWMTE
ncbi:thiamine pyrophosphate-binding protein [Natrialbaceae archaeon A-gly3]